MKQAYAALDLKAVAAIGTSPYGPLRVVASPDPRLEVKRQQQMWPEPVFAHVGLWLPPLIADRVAEAVLGRSKKIGKHARGSWVSLSAREIARLVHEESRALGVDALTGERRDQAAERWAQRRWG